MDLQEARRRFEAAAKILEKGKDLTDDLDFNLTGEDNQPQITEYTK